MRAGLPCLLLITACTGRPDAGTPAATVDAFLTAVKGGEERAARQWLVAAERDDGSLGFQAEGAAHFTVGAARTEGDRAVVTLKAKEGKDGALVLQREEGRWRISLHESMREMLGGADVEAELRKAAEQMGQQIKAQLESRFGGPAGPPGK